METLKETRIGKMVECVKEVTIEEWLDQSARYVAECEGAGVPFAVYTPNTEEFLMPIDAITMRRMYDKLIPDTCYNYLYKKYCDPVKADTPDHGIGWNLRSVLDSGDVNEVLDFRAEEYLNEYMLAIRAVQRAMVLKLDPRLVKNEKLDGIHWVEAVEKRWENYLKQVVRNAIDAGAYTIEKYDDCQLCEDHEGARKLETKCSVLRAAGYDVAHFHSATYTVKEEPHSDAFISCDAIGETNVPTPVWKEMGATICTVCHRRPITNKLFDLHMGDICLFYPEISSYGSVFRGVCPECDRHAREAEKAKRPPP